MNKRRSRSLKDRNTIKHVLSIIWIFFRYRGNATRTNLIRYKISNSVYRIQKGYCHHNNHLKQENVIYLEQIHQAPKIPIA